MHPVFKPTRRELREVQRLAHEVECFARGIINNAGFPTSYPVRAAEYSARAFALSSRITGRG